MFVSFVSSGPGAPDLLTLRAVDRLRVAEIILYDDFSAGEILDFAQETADLICVGKRAGRASPRQAHVNQLLIEYAQAGLRVVRLKSGDAGLFGRLEEEIQALISASIAFEIIPGVSSVLAAAAHAQMPLTRRLLSRRVQFITGHDVSGDLPENLNISALADPHATTAIFMGKRTFPALAQKLIASGLPPDTPALLAENISRLDESCHHTTLSTLSTHLSAHVSDAPAIIIFGPLLHKDG